MRRGKASIGLLLAATLAHNASVIAADSDAQKADRHLNGLYQNLLLQVGDERKEALRNAQRAWIKFRDNTCSFESSLKTAPPKGGTGPQAKPVPDELCIQRLTLERTEHLRRYSEILNRAARAPVALAPPAAQTAPDITGCRIEELPADFTVQAIGIYEGALETDVHLTARHETTAAEVIVNMPGKNVVLVLMGHDPVLWHVKRTPDSRIAAVLVGGYAEQAVLGIERSVPLSINTYEGRKDCGQYFSAREAGPELLKANAEIRNRIGREIDRLWSNHKGGRIYIGPPPPASVTLISPDEYKVEDYTSLPRFPQGLKGIDRLVEMRLLRRATPADLDAWVEKASTRYSKFGPDVKLARPNGPRGTYVVVGKLTYPTGLYGGTSVAFLIPPGIPMPDGNPGHSAVYFLEDGTCRGAVCGENHR